MVRHIDAAMAKEAESGMTEKSVAHEQDITHVLPAPVPEYILPDGGLRAWLQVFGSFLLYFNLWGYTFAFGSFQNYYETEYLKGTSASAISWIGSIQSFLVILSGVVSGPLFDLGYFKLMVFGGALLSTVGSLSLSFATTYWQIFLSQGICVGLGCGVLFVPTMALATRSFNKRRSLAVGIMSCGAPFGAILYALIFDGLLPKIGFAWTARSMAFFMLGTYIIALPLLLWRVTNTGRIGGGAKRKLFDKSALTDLPFYSYSFAASTQFMAYLTPFFFMPAFAQTQLGTSARTGTYVLIVSQAASIPGRIASAIAANQIGVMVPWVVCATISGVMCLAWIGVHTLPSFFVFAALYGCFSGALIPLPPSVFPKACPDLRVLGTRLGMAQGISSVFNLIGPPIGGALLKANSSTGSNWFAIQLWSGLVLLFATLQIVGFWVLLIRRRGTKVLV